MVPPTYPENGLVFDESYFLPQVESYVVNRYFFDIHPPLGKMFMYFGTILVNPDAAEQLDPEKLANKVDDYKTPLDKMGIRLFPQVFGALTPPLLFLLVIELIQLRRREEKSSAQIGLTGLLTSFGVALFAVFANIMVVEARYALLTPFLLFFMFLALFLLFKYYNAQKQRNIELWFALAGIGLGLAISVKWLALSITPIFVLLILDKEFKFPSKRRELLRIISLLVQRFVFLAAAAATVYLLLFAWHFSMLKNYSPAAWEVSESYQDELKTGESQVGLIPKVVEWHQIAARYSSKVPALDYSKPDEIGSMWATWPLMARPISYYWQTDGDGIYDHIYLIGNPLLWVFSLMGIVALAGLGIARLFSDDIKFNLRHLLIILLYFGNWLPYAFIERVMYLYHYIPAYIFGLLAFGLLLHDFVLPRLRQLAHAGRSRLPKFATRFVKAEYFNYSLFGLGLATIIMVMVVFFIYAPFTYLLPLNQEQFNQRILLKEWHMKWPGE